MVTLTVYAAAGDFDLSRYLSATTTFVDARRRGTNYFLSDTDIYGSTMLARRDADGQWDHDLFLGGTTIGPAGNLRFAPDARFDGEIGDKTVGQAMVSFVNRGLSDAKIEAKILQGDDVLIGNRYDVLFNGMAGDDVLEGGLGRDQLFGGDGNDLIITGGIHESTDYPSRDEAYGENGDDVLVMTDNVYFSTANGGPGDDFIFLPNSGKVLAYGDGYQVPTGSDAFYLASLHEFWVPDFEDAKDTLYFEVDAFPMLSNGVTDDNIVFGDANVIAKDPDDYLLVAVVSSSGVGLYFDVDGSGPAKRQFLAELDRSQHLTATNFSVGHVDPPTAAIPVGHAERAPLAHHAVDWPADPTLHLV